MSDASHCTADISLVVRRSWPSVRRDFIATGTLLCLLGAKFVANRFAGFISLMLLSYVVVMLPTWAPRVSTIDGCPGAFSC
ncbi:MAG: hypothetical protein ABI411_16060 [Tahibacter sp.]